MPFTTHRPLVLPSSCTPVSDHATLASTLDRAADAALFFGRAIMAERLSTRAAELRESAP
jgi:hypothetical protein